jgi:hypothetical protein
MSADTFRLNWISSSSLHSRVFNQLERSINPIRSESKELFSDLQLVAFAKVLFPEGDTQHSPGSPSTHGAPWGHDPKLRKNPEWVPLVASNDVGATLTGQGFQGVILPGAWPGF